MGRYLVNLKLGRLLMFVVAVGSGLGLASVSFSTIIPGGGPPKSDCYAVLEARGSKAVKNTKTLECEDGDPSCDQDGQCNDSCTFQVRRCVKDTTQTKCTAPATLLSYKGSNPKKPATVTPIPDPGSACGAIVDEVVALKVKGSKKKPGTLKFGAVAKAPKGTKPSSDGDSYVLKCIPRKTPCPQLPTGCGDGTVSGTEQCDPPGQQGQCTTGQICNASCQCEATTPCACGSTTPTKLKFTTGLSPFTCGHGTNGTTNVLDLPCGTLWFGGGSVPIALPNQQPDMGVSFENITQCSGTVFGLANTTATDTGSSRKCTKGGGPLSHCAGGEPGTDTQGLCTTDADCLARTGHCQPDPNCTFGAPLPVPNDAAPVVSTCVVNVVSQDAVGFGDCSTGAINVKLPLASRLYLGSGDYLEDDPNVPYTLGIQACPICVDDGTGNKCKGGDNDGMACTPETSVLGAAYPTSGDCPPKTGDFLGILSVPFALTTGTATMTPSLTSQPGGNGYCGFCRAADRSAFQGDPTSPTPGPPVPCATAADCTDANFPLCEQKDGGAFAQPTVSQITEIGNNAGDLRDGAEHEGTLVSTFCLPPSFNPLVDPSAGLPGPGATALPGKAQLVH